jgi:hypothetical protein
MQDERLEKTLVEEGTLGGFTLENIVARYALAAENREKSEVWQQYYVRVVQYAGRCVTQLLERCRPALEQLPPQSLETLLLEGIATSYGRPNADITTMVTALKTVWKLSTFPHLMIKIERKALENPPDSNAITWNLTVGSASQFLTSPKFNVSGINCEIQVWYSSPEDRLDCFLATSPSQPHFTSPLIAAFTVSLTIWPDECAKEASVITLIMGSKGHKMVRRGFGVSARSGSAGITVQAKVRLETVYSSLFDYFACHFSDPAISEGAGRLKGDRILQLLSMNNLQVESEDQVLRLVGQWAQRHKGEEDLILQLGILLEQVRWPFVTTGALVDCSRLYPSLKESVVFKAALKRQFEGRSGLMHLKEQPAREGYKSRQYREPATNLSTFLGELVTVLMTLDFTQSSSQQDQDLADRLRISLKEKERHARDLRRSLSLIEQVFTSGSPFPYSPTLKPGSSEKRQAELKSHSTTHSLAALRSGRPTIDEEELEESNVDGKVVSLLHSLWSKVQEKATSPRNSAM